MKTYRRKGTITVFLSLLSVLFLSLLCTVAESARIQGCRAKAAASLDMGLFSVFGEFENDLLEKYDVFGLDGSGGNGSFREEEVRQKLEDYMSYNVSTAKDLMITHFDPFALRLNAVKQNGFQLLTDENGAAFYQQAVGFMKHNLGAEVVSTWMERSEDAAKLEEAGKEYEEKQKNSDSRMQELSDKQAQQEKEKKEQEKVQQAQAAQRGEVIVREETPGPTVPASENPLEIIKKIRKKGLMGLVLGDKKPSEKKLPAKLPSKRKCRKGSLPVEKEHGGMTADILFQEYLFGRFSLFTDETYEGEMAYELEYILCGKNTDEKNLKAVVTKLLFMREGANFVYITSNPEMKTEADGLSALLTGWIPLPGITAATSYALQLVWAYGESLLDVRMLLAGGRVPILKTPESWRLGLREIPRLLDMLDETRGTATEKSDGLTYGGYLQILYTLGAKKKYPMRALDVIEMNLRKQGKTANFKADNMITKMAAGAEFEIPPVFLRVSSVFLKTGLVTKEYRIEGSFAYQ